jgi:hypothetical protein
VLRTEHGPKVEHGPKTLQAFSEEQIYNGMYLRRAVSLPSFCCCIIAAHISGRNEEKDMPKVLRVARWAKRELMFFLPRQKLAEAFRTCRANEGV